MSYHVAPTPYAVFSSSQTQNIANAANAQEVTLNTTGTAKGISVVSNSRITLPQVGNYALAYSAIGHNAASSSAKTMNIFLRKNGTTAVANSSTIVAVAKDNPTTIAATFDVECTTSGDYYELMLVGENTDCQILATAAQAAVPGVSPAQPACPSIVIAVWQIN